MNPQHTLSTYYQSYQQHRDKFKSQIEPIYSFSSSHLHTRPTVNNYPNSFNKITNQVDRYKTFYTDSKDYSQLTGLQNGTQATAINRIDTKPMAGFADGTISSSRIASNLSAIRQQHNSSQPSQQRQRFFTINDNQQSPLNSNLQSQHPHRISSSIQMGQQNTGRFQFQSSPSQQTNTKKEYHQFINQRFVTSTVESVVESREKRRLGSDSANHHDPSCVINSNINNFNQSNAKDYNIKSDKNSINGRLQGADRSSKKISLKRQLAGNSPKNFYEAVLNKSTVGTPSAHSLQSSQIFSSNNQYNNKQYNNQVKTNQPNIDKDKMESKFEDTQKRHKNAGQNDNVSLYSNSNITSSNRSNSISKKVNSQLQQQSMSLIKTSKIEQVNRVQKVQKTTNHNEFDYSSLFLQNHKQQSPIASNTESESYRNLGSTAENNLKQIRKNNLNGNYHTDPSSQSNKLPTSKPNPTKDQPPIPATQTRQQKPQQLSPLIDQQLYTDMKISRIEESTQNIEQKLQKLSTIFNKIQKLQKVSRQQQMSINEINLFISKQEEEGITSHDIKRIKKELKIMKTNFQTAFTSMTDQINRKLVKEENIMKSLSQEIKLVAEQNYKLSESLEEKSRKVETIEKSMTSFMRESEERMENFILSDSMSSSKRSKNHSFEYGLQLKNMSVDENYLSVNNNSVNNLNTGGNKAIIESINKKIENIEREIKKMKVFHIEEKQLFGQKQSDLGSQIQELKEKVQKIYASEEIHSMARQVSEAVLESKLSLVSKEHQERCEQGWAKLQNELTKQQSQIEQLQKICHEQFYDYRMNKFHQSTQKQLSSNSINNNDRQYYTKQFKQLEAKHRQLVSQVMQQRQKVELVEQKHYAINKFYEEQRMKELKHSGDIRELQSQLKQLLSQESMELKRQKSSTEAFQQNVSKSLAELQARVDQTERIDRIQNENIESVNRQFQRVINKQIIPKFGEVHSSQVELAQRVASFANQLSLLTKKVQENSATITLNKQNSVTALSDFRELQSKIEQFFTKSVSKFITQRVKLISTQLISSKSPLSKIGLFKDSHKRTPHSNSSQLPSLFSDVSQSLPRSQQQLIGKEETYLVDENGYLMDWQGCYLMEYAENGNRQKITLNEDQIYFMEANGIDVKRFSSNL